MGEVIVAFMCFGVALGIMSLEDHITWREIQSCQKVCANNGGINTLGDEGTCSCADGLKRELSEREKKGGEG